MSKQKKPKNFLPQPIYVGGPKAMSEFIYKNLRYPKAALADRIEGVVLVEIEINHKGKVTGTRVMQSINKDFDAEACRVAKKLVFEVEKARGIKITFHKKVKFAFKAPLIQEVQQPQPQQQIQYTITPSKAPAKKEEEKPKPAGNTINYTIRIG